MHPVCQACAAAAEVLTEVMPLLHGQYLQDAVAVSEQCRAAVQNGDSRDDLHEHVVRMTAILMILQSTTSSMIRTMAVLAEKSGVAVDAEEVIGGAKRLTGKLLADRSDVQPDPQPETA